MKKTNDSSIFKINSGRKKQQLPMIGISHTEQNINEESEQLNLKSRNQNSLTKNILLDGLDDMERSDMLEKTQNNGGHKSRGSFGGPSFVVKEAMPRLDLENSALNRSKFGPSTLNNSALMDKNNNSSMRGSFRKDNQESMNRSFTKPTEPAIKRLRRAFLAIRALVRFWKILENIKQYGTSSNLYNIAFRSRKSVKKSIFPIAKSQNHVKVKVKMFMLIRHNSPFLIVWNIVLFLFVLYALILMPYLSVFSSDTNPYQLIFETMMDVCFIVDVILNFFTTIVNSKDEIITDRCLIAKNYLKGYFWLDVLSSIPFGLLFDNISSFNKLLRLFKLPRLIRMAKIAKLMKFKNYYKGTSLSYFIRIHGGMIKTIMLGIVTLMMLHLATCVWCAIGMMEGDAPFTWIDRYGLDTATNFEIYLTGLYFCLVSLTTVGYGDYTAYTNSRFDSCS